MRCSPALTVAALIGLVALVAGACSSGDDDKAASSSTTLTSASASTTLAPTTSITGGLITAPPVTTVAAGDAGGGVGTTAAGGDPAPTAAPDPNSATTTPGTPASSDDGSASGSGSGSGAGPVGGSSGGDPDTFCSAIQQVFPLFYVVSVGSLLGDDAATEVAMAPLLDGPLQIMATSAPTAVKGAFQQWRDRNAKALAAFRGTGATDDQTTKYSADLQAQIDAVIDSGGEPPAPLEVVGKYGIDAAKLESQATQFAAANPSFADFTMQLEQGTTLSENAQTQLEADYPCASDIGSFAGGA
jgi:hypothetical protein